MIIFNYFCLFMIVEHPFEPYILKIHSQRLLHIEESSSRRVFLFLFFRVFPVLLFIAILSILFIFDFPTGIALLLILISILPFSIFFQDYIIESMLSTDDVSVIYMTFKGRKKVDLKLKEIEAITLETYYLNPGAGDIYRLKIKGSNQQIPLLSIPFLSKKAERTMKINEALQKITGLSVQTY